MGRTKKTATAATGLEIAFKALEAQFPEERIFRLGDQPIRKIDVISTSSLALDLALGIGGIPRGKITEIYGPESSGKTTLCQHIIANAQKAGLNCLFLDSENSFDTEYAKKCGVDVDNLWFAQPSSGEITLHFAQSAIKSKDCGLIVIDSVAALTPQAELEGEIGDAHVGRQARLMGQFLRMVMGEINITNTAIVFTNQVRSNIGPMAGNPESTPGGKALKFAASIRMRVAKIEDIKNGNDVNGIRVKATIKKNKTAPPFKVAEYSILFAEGISYELGLLEQGLEANIITKRGPYMYYGDNGIQGREKFRLYLKDNPEIATTIEQSIRAAYLEEETTNDEVNDRVVLEELDYISADPF